MTANVTPVALDANILANPVTRTLLIVGGAQSGYRALWGATAEREAGRHMRSRAVQPRAVRERFEIELAPTGEDAWRFTSTDGADRQILADAVASAAQFLVTEDVDDFGLNDLASTGISAVNPDVFMAERLTRAAYTNVIGLFVQRQVNPPTTPERFHAVIARRHPRLFAAHADLYDVAPEPTIDNEPSVIFRGVRCLRCERLSKVPITHADGLCITCS